jgi:putative hemin transport protein
MDARVTRRPEDIRQARSDNPTMRERDLALQLGISEAELVAAEVGLTARRIEPRVGELLTEMETLGEVMALTRNESAVHEKIGVYDKVVTGDHTAMVLSAEIDLRIFPGQWAHGFAVEKRDGDAMRHSLQFFDAAGEAVHKIHLRLASDVAAYERLVGRLESADQSPTIEIRHDLPASDSLAGEDTVDLDELRRRWSKMTDTHQFFGMLKTLKVGRLPAVRKVGADYAWQAGGDAVSQMMHRAAEAQFPIMCFVGNRGCIQIHSGPITTIKPMGPWINVMDPTFHLHLRLDHIAETWVVRKPTKDGHVTSVEAYDRHGEMVIQFFGKRHEGVDERADWRALAESLPRAESVLAESVVR